MVTSTMHLAGHHVLLILCLTLVLPSCGVSGNDSKSEQGTPDKVFEEQFDLVHRKKMELVTLAAQVCAVEYGHLPPELPHGVDQEEYEKSLTVWFVSMATSEDASHRTEAPPVSQMPYGTSQRAREAFSGRDGFLWESWFTLRRHATVVRRLKVEKEQLRKAFVSNYSEYESKISALTRSNAHAVVDDAVLVDLFCDVTDFP